MFAGFVIQKVSVSWPGCDSRLVRHHNDTQFHVWRTLSRDGSCHTGMLYQLHSERSRDLKTPKYSSRITPTLVLRFRQGSQTTSAFGDLLTGTGGGNAWPSLEGRGNKRRITGNASESHTWGGDLHLGTWMVRRYAGGNIRRWVEGTNSFVSLASGFYPMQGLKNHHVKVNIRKGKIASNFRRG